MHITLNSFGISLTKENNLFAVQTPEGKQLIPPEKVKSITISKGAKISSDAVLLAIDNQVDIIFTDAVGNPAGRVWSIKYGSVSDIRRKQLEFIYGDKAVSWIKELILEKINAQVAILLAFRPLEPPGFHVFGSAINALSDYGDKIRATEGITLSELKPTLRGWEGAASKRYFECMRSIIPSFYGFQKRAQYPATDPFNAMLNYGYGMMYGKVEGALIKAGIDPYVGVFHRDDYNRPALVYDVIEVFRHWIDYVVIHLAIQDAFNEDCFVYKNEACYLEGLGKRILVQSVNDYLAEIIKINGQERSRSYHIDLYSQKLAKLFLNS